MYLEFREVMNHLTYYNILSNSQHGFRAQRSCETQLVVTIQELAETQSEGKKIDAILLDFSKAFDKVLINARKSKSPSTVPWGAPESTAQVDECVPSRSTCWCNH
jgi:hypothetical protein